jgi:hypothetical protein
LFIGDFEGGSAGAYVWSSSVSRLEGLTDEGTNAEQDQTWWRPIRTEPHSTGDGSKALGMGLQHPGWPHRVGGGDVLHSPYVTKSSQTSAMSVAVHLSRVSLPLFEGCDMEEGREWVPQCQGMTPAIPHSTCTVLGMAA